MKIEIRKMKPEDLDDARSILAKWNMSPVSPNSEIPNPERDTIEVSNAFVALDGINIIGMCSYFQLSGDVAETASLAVDPAYLGSGIGSRLQIARLEDMHAKGFKRIRTEADRPHVIDWYVRKFGYRVLGTNAKKHAFSLTDVGAWTVLELDLAEYFKNSND